MGSAAERGCIAGFLLAIFIVGTPHVTHIFARKTTMVIDLPHFGKLTEEQASDFVQRMMEYSLLHEKMQSCRQDAHANFIANSTPSDKEKGIFEFFSKNIEEACGILSDFMVGQCLHWTRIADEQRTLGMTGTSNRQT